MFIFFAAYRELVRFDRYIAAGDFAKLYERVRNCPVAAAGSGENAVTLRRISDAMDLACIWFWKEASCLHRSAAAACLLRHHGIAAQLVIGAQAMPFRAHAWIEVDGCVINDRPYISEKYAVLDRC